MDWTQEAENAIKKVPFFVRKKVRVRVEKEAAAVGRHDISLADVRRTQARYLKKMSEAIKGYQIDTCFGGGGCPNRVLQSETLLEKIETRFQKADLLAFLKQTIGDDLKYHHEFRVTLAECPNACSQPQIKDIGIIAAAAPGLTDTDCTMCLACVEACPDDCIAFHAGIERPDINFKTCMHCGKCIAACPTGTITETTKGFKVMLGGKLGRHPQLARELSGIFSESEVLEIVDYCIHFYKKHSLNGRRFAYIFKPADFEKLASRLPTQPFENKSE